MPVVNRLILQSCMDTIRSQDLGFRSLPQTFSELHKSLPIKLAFCGSSSPEKPWLGALSTQAKFCFAGPTRKSLGKGY